MQRIGSFCVAYETAYVCFWQTATLLVSIKSPQAETNRLPNLTCCITAIPSFVISVHHSHVQPFWRRLHMGRKLKKRRGGRPKAKLGLPDLDQSKAADICSLRSPESQRGYTHAIDEFIEWYCSEPRLSFNRAVVLRYRIHMESRNLAPGTINVRWLRLRRLAYEAADAGLLSRSWPPVSVV
jgi:hypothetical protein